MIIRDTTVLIHTIVHNDKNSPVIVRSCVSVPMPDSDALGIYAFRRNRSRLGNGTELLSPASGTDGFGKIPKVDFFSLFFEDPTFLGNSSAITVTNTKWNLTNMSVGIHIFIYM